MDNDSKRAVEILETIGKCRTKFTKFSSELQTRPGVFSTESEVDCKLYASSGTSLSFYLDAELKTGNSISFFLGLNWDEIEWIISARISLNDEQGYKVIKAFPDRKTEHYNDLLILLLSAASELLNISAISDFSI